MVEYYEVRGVDIFKEAISGTMILFYDLDYKNVAFLSENFVHLRLTICNF